MTIASFFFGLVVATFIGLGFHLWKGGGFFIILLDIVLSWVGFYAGHFLSKEMGWEMWIVGPIHIGPAIAGSILFLLLGNWLTTPQESSER